MDIFCEMCRQLEQTVVQCCTVKDELPGYHNNVSTVITFHTRISSQYMNMVKTAMTKEWAT